MSLGPIDRPAPPPLTAQELRDRFDRTSGELPTGLGGNEAHGRGARGQGADKALVELWEARIGAAQAIPGTPPAEETPPDAIAAAPHLPLALVTPDAPPPPSPPLSSARTAETAALADRLSGEIRLAQATLGHVRGGEGLTLRLDLGATMLGVQSVTLSFGQGTLVVSLALGPGGGAHDLPQAAQALAALLAVRHPGRTVRIEEERRIGEAGSGEGTGDEPFDPFRPRGVLR